MLVVRAGSLIEILLSYSVPYDVCEQNCTSIMEWLVEGIQGNFLYIIYFVVSTTDALKTHTLGLFPYQPIQHAHL